MPQKKDEILEVMKYLRDKKMKAMKADMDRLKQGKTLKSIDQDELLEKESKEVKIKTGTLIDEMIGGGLPPSSNDAVTSMLLFGEYGAGKTQTAFTMCVEAPDDVIYVDLEGSYRAERIKAICKERRKDWDVVKKKIHLFRPTNWIEQMMVLDSMPSPADAQTGRIGLVIVDSLTKAFRGVEFAGRQSLNTKQPMIREFMFQMGKIVKAFGSALIFTTQIYETPTSNPFLPAWAGHKAVGGASILHQAAFVIFLRRGTGNVRIAQLKDSSWQALAERPFVITEGGIEDVPEDAVAREALMKRAEKFDKTQRQEDLKKKVKRTKRAYNKCMKNALEANMTQEDAEQACSEFKPLEEGEEGG